MPADRCPQGHSTLTAADRDSRGHCRECERQRARERRASDGAALIVVRALEAAGARFVMDGKPVDPAVAAKQIARLHLAGEL